LQLLINERGKSLTELNPERENVLKECVSTKKTVIYQAKNKTRTGKEIWVQTALTPVLDDEGNIVKLIAIESDITKLKEQEHEIKQKNEELQMQKAELQAQKDLLEEVNHQIRDSINYAQTIQSAILPLEKDISSHFEHFLVYLPRDIVSGDFYWFSNPQENLFFMATVDCTGHGVPGAFMSLISSRMLDEIIAIRKIYEPKEILDTLNNLIIKSLSQETTNNRDGMDLALVRIRKDNEKFEICFAGAKRPLVYYEKGKNIEVIKGSRRSVGGIMAFTSFEYEQKKVILEKDDMIYLSTDGLIDQNNKERKRFGTPRFLRLLDEVKDLPLQEQKIEILTKLEEYKEDEHQRDDITVWGIKL
jgi:serine phosphatase RsbU (regulator of sigma subunit)